MTDTNIKVREHYSAVGLTHRIKAALATVTPESGALTVAQLAPLDQFERCRKVAVVRCDSVSMDLSAWFAS